MTEDYKIIEEKHYWTSDHKLKFCGYGEWVEEADFTKIEYRGYEARLVRVFKIEPYAKEEAYFGGYLCGYVKIPEIHPYFRQKEIDLECHGGITYNESHEEHWVGFDCMHSGDFVPTSEHMKRTIPELIEIKKAFSTPEGMEEHPWFKPIYRNINYCIHECITIIDQLIESALVKDKVGKTDGMD